MESANSPIDREHLAEMTGGDVEFESELMLEFLSSIPKLIESLESGIREGHAKDIEMAAHTIKGSCRSLGANALSMPCEKLETIARNAKENGTPLGDTNHLLTDVHQLYEELREYVVQEWKVKAA